MKRDPSAPIGTKGPAALLDALAHLEKGSAGRFTAARDRWLMDSRAPASSWPGREHRVLSRALVLVREIDGLNLPNLACPECVNRRRQLIETARRDDLVGGSWDSAHLYMGEDEGGTGVRLASPLRAHVAPELPQEAAIEKEKRKRPARPKRRPRQRPRTPWTNYQ